MRAGAPILPQKNIEKMGKTSHICAIALCSFYAHWIGYDNRRRAN
jgi:hypothetical protein